MQSGLSQWQHKQYLSPLGLRGSSPRPHHASSCWLALAASVPANHLQDGGACVEVPAWCSPSLSGWPVCAGPFRAWSPATTFHGVWDSTGPAHPDGYYYVVNWLLLRYVSTYQRSFAVNGPRTWNSLPAELRTPDMTLCCFNRHLKAHHFQQWSALLYTGR